MESEASIAIESVDARALHFDERRLPHAGPADALPACRPLRALERREPYRLAASRRAIQGLDHTDVLQPLVPGRLRLTIPLDTVGEVEQLGSKLVALAEALAGGPTVDRQLVGEAFRVFICGVNDKLTSGADDPVGGHVRGVETRHERRDALPLEAQQGTGRFVDLAQLGGPAVDAEGHHFRRLGPEEIPGGVDAVDADVVQRSAAHVLLRPDVVCPDGHRERRIEELRFADPAAAYEIDRLQVDFLEVQPVGDHQLDAIPAARVDHAPALTHRHRHRLLAQHMHAGPRRSDRVLGMEMIRERNIHGVHLLEALLVLRVREHRRHTVPLRQQPQLGRIVADQGREARVPACVREGRQHRHLCNVTESHDGISNRGLAASGSQRQPPHGTLNSAVSKYIVTWARNGFALLPVSRHAHSWRLSVITTFCSVRPKYHCARRKAPAISASTSRPSQPETYSPYETVSRDASSTDVRMSKSL